MHVRKIYFSLILKLFIGTVILFYIGGIFAPEIGEFISSFLYDLQSSIAFVRLVPDRDNMVFTGRDLLNQAILFHWGQAPWFGLGNDHPIFLYGINEHLEAAIWGTRIAGSESGLNVAAKYGLFFFCINIIMILAPIYAQSHRTQASEHRLAYSISAVAILTFVFNGGFTNYYGLSAVSMYLILTFYFRAKLQSTLNYDQSQLADNKYRAVVQ